MESVKAALLRFVDEQTTDRDVLALMTTAGKPGVAGEFTTDRGKLRERIKKLHSGQVWTESFLTPALCGKVMRRQGEAVTLATQIIQSEEYTTGSLIAGESSDPLAEASSKCMMLLLEAATRRRAATSSIRAATERLAGIPGQRIVALFSEGFSMTAPGGEVAIADVRPAMSGAVHAGVMVYTLDARVALDTKPINIGSFHLSSEMNDAVRDYQHGMALLASQTGGEAFFNIDGLSDCLQKMLNNNRICYHFEYSAPQNKNPGDYRNITVLVKNHPEYRVRAPKGYALAVGP
jgi:VWFA-related protein